jgi:hypothetical protein
MAQIAGVNFPCTDCKSRFKRCRIQVDVFKRVFFAIGTGEQVTCLSYEEEWYRGLEGCKP